MSLKIVAILAVLVLIDQSSSRLLRPDIWRRGAGPAGKGNRRTSPLKPASSASSWGTWSCSWPWGSRSFPTVIRTCQTTPSNRNAPTTTVWTDGTEYKGTEVGGYVKIGTRLFVDSLYLNLIGGATVVTESDIVQSPATDRYYEASSDTISQRPVRRRPGISSRRSSTGSWFLWWITTTGGG